MTRAWRKTWAQHQGGCQCGQVRFRVDLELDDSIQCNCSRCGKLGSVLAFADSASFTLEQGDDVLTEFRFNTHRVAHLFCRACGIQSFGRGTAPNGQEVIAVNLRRLDGVDVFTRKPQPVDGKTF